MENLPYIIYENWINILEKKKKTVMGQGGSLTCLAENVD